MSSITWAQVPAEDASGYAEERRLIEAAKCDSGALAELYRQHYAAIASYVHRRVADRHDADDIVSDVFLSMVRHLPQYRCRGIPFRAWLFRLATTELSRWARRRRRWARHQLKEISASGTELEHDTEMVDLVLSTLPPRLQAVLSLHYLEEMNVNDIAIVLNCSIGTVKSRLSEGRGLMRRRLNMRGFSDGDT